MRAILVSILFSAVFPAVAGSESTLHALSTSDLVRTETTAKAVAIQALQRDQIPSYVPYGRVLELTRAHCNWDQIRRGEFVWLVSVLNAGSSDLNPIPEELAWVRATDGVVVFLRR